VSDTTGSNECADSREAASPGREEAEDIWAEATEATRQDAGQDDAVGLGLAATAVLGAVELPIGAALRAGYALFRRR
jgi:hypothetical protein